MKKDFTGHKCARQEIENKYKKFLPSLKTKPIELIMYVLSSRFMELGMGF